MLGDVLSKIGDAQKVKIDLANASATSGWNDKPSRRVKAE